MAGNTPSNATGKASILERFVGWFRVYCCSHEFLLNDLAKTGIPSLKKPSGNGYDEWSEYYEKLYTHESETKRVRWPCRKCGRVFYAHCGLDISPKHGPTIA